MMQTLMIILWVLFVGTATTVAGKWVYDYWTQLYPTAPTSMPTAPTSMPTANPTVLPTSYPTAVPSTPTYAPTAMPSAKPTTSTPTYAPTPKPTTHTPTLAPTTMPTPYDNCFEMAFYFCLTCVPDNMKPALPCGRNYYAPAKCPDNAHCSRGYYTCDPGYKSTYIAPFPNPWGDYCEHCSIPHLCIPETTYLRH